MEHQEIRFKILYNLYKKHYSDALGHQQQTDKVIEESGLANIDKSEVYGDIVYLENKGLIKGSFMLGYAHPLWVIITSYGIDIVENGVNNFMQNIDTIKFGNNQARTEIKTLAKAEDGTSKKIRKVVDFLEKHQALISLANEMAKIVSGRIV